MMRIKHERAALSPVSLMLAGVFGLSAITATGVLAQSGHGAGQPAICQIAAGGHGRGQLPPWCESASAEDPHVEAQLAQLRLAVSGFYSIDVAKAAGWNVFLSECIEAPMGGMGYHLGNIEQLNEPSLSLLRPEALLYAPMADGSMEFLGVEYIIPAPLWDDEAPPEFLGEVLHFNPMQNIWALHVWVGKENPDGMFADFNPTVSCEFAPDEN